MQKLWAITVAGWLSLGALVVPQSTQSSPAAIDVRSVGPQIGATAPAFHLPDQAGTVRSLESTMGQAGVVLVFFRSADW